MYLYSALFVVPHTKGAQVRITQCYLQITPYLPLPRKHSPDGASPDWGCRQLQPTTDLSTSKGWKAESAWLAGLQRTVYPLKWSPVSHRSSAGQRKFACQRPTFYHWGVVVVVIEVIQTADSLSVVVVVAATTQPSDTLRQVDQTHVARTTPAVQRYFSYWI